MKRLAIITLFVYSNYGNRLQNYALQEFLKNEGYDVTTLHFYKPKNKNKHLKEFTKKHIQAKLAEKEPFDDYDYYIIGSDQVFNYGLKAAKKLDVVRRAAHLPSEKLVAFAASFGRDLLEGSRVKFKQHLGKYKAISVREEKGKNIVSNISGRDATVLLDPVFLLSAGEWSSLCSNKQKGHVFCFFLGKEGPVNSVKKIAKNSKKLMFNGRWASIPDYLGGIRNASLVVTDSYHAVVFSIIFKVPFLLVDIQTKVTSRFDTLLGRLGLESRRVYKINNHKGTNLFHTDYSGVDKMVAQGKSDAIRFLRMNIT